MRKLYHRQLVEARHEMLSIYETIDLALHDAVRAFISGDKKLAGATREKTYQIDARCANLEAVCYNLIATQGPVASDFRLLQTIIYTDFCLQRMCDKVRRTARAAKLRVSADIELPAELIELVEEEAKTVYRVMGTAASVLVLNDLGSRRLRRVLPFVQSHVGHRSRRGERRQLIRRPAPRNHGVALSRPVRAVQHRRSRAHPVPAHRPAVEPDGNRHFR